MLGSNSSDNNSKSSNLCSMFTKSQHGFSFNMQIIMGLMSKVRHLVFVQTEMRRRDVFKVLSLTK